MELALTDEGQHVLAKRGLVGPDDPADEGRRKAVEGHEGRVDGPLVLDPAGVQDSQAGYGLERDQAGRGQLPRVIAIVKPVRLVGEGCVWRRHGVGYADGKSSSFPKLQGLESREAD